MVCVCEGACGRHLLRQITPRAKGPRRRKRVLRAILAEKASDPGSAIVVARPSWRPGNGRRVRVFNRPRRRGRTSARSPFEREEIERLAKGPARREGDPRPHVYGRWPRDGKGRQRHRGPEDFKKDSKITRAVIEEYAASQWWLLASPTTTCGFDDRDRGDP